MHADPPTELYTRLTILYHLGDCICSNMYLELLITAINE
jgi:hypothetical protein